MLEQFILGKAIPVPKGNYSAGTRYDRLNMVTSHGGAYIATKDNVQGVQPGVTSGWESYWQCVGNGIVSITKTAETASQATFTVSYSDGTTSTYTLDKPTGVSDSTVDFGSWTTDTFISLNSGDTVSELMTNIAANFELVASGKGSAGFTLNDQTFEAQAVLNGSVDCNGIVFLNMFLNNTRQLTAGTIYNVGSVNDYAPLALTGNVALSCYIQGIPCFGEIDVTGAIHIFTTANVPIGTDISISGSYLGHSEI